MVLIGIRRGIIQNSEYLESSSTLLKKIVVEVNSVLRFLGGSQNLGQLFFPKNREKYETIIFK